MMDGYVLCFAIMIPPRGEILDRSTVIYPLVPDLQNLLCTLQLFKPLQCFVCLPNVQCHQAMGSLPNHPTTSKRTWSAGILMVARISASGRLIHSLHRRRTCGIGVKCGSAIRNSLGETVLQRVALPIIVSYD